MARSDTLQGSLELLVLKILARRGPLHGYGIALQIEQISEDMLRIEEGSLYPALHRMEESGFVAARWEQTGSGRRARTYQITEAGQAQLAASEARWTAVTAAVNRVLRMA